MDQLPPGRQRRFEIDKRAIAVFNVAGTFYALRDICPHMGGRLSKGAVLSMITAVKPGCYEFHTDRKVVRCPWHGFEYELGTGQSWFDPMRNRVRAYPVSVESGHELIGTARRPGPYVAETMPIYVENNYVVVEM